ncbi:MAG TPA: S9 family peptidase [Polyangiaceae bacterium]|nr:S9 family peptidase [Polyangiaceae bacterium]
MTIERLVAASSAWSVSLSPDGTRLAYVSDRDGAPRLVVCNLDGSAERTLETGEEPVQEAHWSVDGGFIAFLVAPGGSPRTEVWAIRADGTDPRRISAAAGTASYLGPWTHRDPVLAVARTTNPTAGVAELIDVETLAVSPIARGGQPVVLDVDAERRVALVRRGPRSARTMWAVSLDTHRETELAFAGEPGSTDLGRLSPDGKTAYLRSNAGRDLFALVAVRLSDLTMDVVAARPDAEVEDVILTADGRTCAVLWNRMGRTECELVDLETGHGTELLLPEPVAHGGAFSRDGRFLTLVLEGPTHPRAVYVLDREQGAFRRVTTQRPGWTDPVTTPTLERLRSSDGLELTGWLYRPASAPGGRHAAVIHLHGGPEAQERPRYNPLFQALAAAGIAVFAPNVRGSSGFGRIFVDSDNVGGRWGAIADVAACAEFVFSQGLATPETLACAGRSYGGYLTLAALVFHPSLFAAGVDVCGMCDFDTFYRDTEPWIARGAYPKYGHPEDDAELLHDLSPIHRFGALRAPLLVVHGENDTNVPLGQALQVVAEAERRGVPVELLVFPGEGHELLLRSSRERFVERTVGWLRRQLLREP